MLEESPPLATTVQITVTALSYAGAIALVSAILLAAVESKFDGYFRSFGKIFGTLLLFSVPISIIAFISGFLTTASRTSAVGNLIPAALALMGGLNIYVFGTDNRFKLLVGYCVTLFALLLLLGTQYGAFRREDERALRFEGLARQELQIRQMRKNLGLPAEIPAWILSTEPK